MRSLLAGSLLALAALAACAPASDIRVAEPIGRILSPELEPMPGRTSIERFDPPGTGTGLELTIGALLRNPNEFGITVTDIEYRVSLTGIDVATGTIEPGVYLDPGATAPVRFDVQTDLERRPRLLRAVVRAFADQPLPYEVRGRIGFTSPSYAFQSRDRTLLQGATLARQTLAQPRLRLSEPASRVYLLRAGVPVVHLVIEATNPGDIGYFLYGRDLSLSLAGEPLDVEDLPPTPVPARQSTRIDLLFYPQPARLSESARRALDAALDGIPTSVVLSGDLKLDVLGVDTFDVPADWAVSGFVDADR